MDYFVRNELPTLSASPPAPQPVCTPCAAHTGIFCTLALLSCPPGWPGRRRAARTQPVAGHQQDVIMINGWSGVNLVAKIWQSLGDSVARHLFSVHAAAGHTSTNRKQIVDSTLPTRHDAATAPGTEHRPASRCVTWRKNPAVTDLLIKLLQATEQMLILAW